MRVLFLGACVREKAPHRCIAQVRRIRTECRILRGEQGIGGEACDRNNWEPMVRGGLETVWFVFGVGREEEKKPSKDESKGGRDGN